MDYKNYIDKNNEFFKDNAFLRLVKFIFTLLKIHKENKKNEITTEILFYIHYLSLKFFNLILDKELKEYDFDNSNNSNNTKSNIFSCIEKINIQHCDEFLQYMLNHDYICELLILEHINHCVNCS